MTIAHSTAESQAFLEEGGRISYEFLAALNLCDMLDARRDACVRPVVSLTAFRNEL